ncbi:MAG: TRAP transporter substrate-binding protein [Spirochaetales bacterium]|jgi:C4-dicarboxylate-binding protein DctP|nr:TRAP transporter substrate-binding protein [Spirochaetales bacterium]
MKKLFSVVSILLILAAAGGCSKKSESVEAAKTYEMKIGHAQPEGNPRQISLQAFEKYVEEKTSGAVQVTVYHSGQLGTEKEMLEQVCSGVIQGFRGGQFDFLPKLLIFSLPFLCENADEINRLMNSDFAREVCADSQKDGAIILGLGDAGGFRQFSNNKRAITKPADLAGLKMRTNGMDTIDKTFKALGASTVSIPYADLYMALKTGVADGQENPWVNVVGMKFFEVQKYFTAIKYQFHPDPFYVNLAWYNGLPENFKKIMQEASIESMLVNNKAIADNQEAALNEIKKHAEVYELSAAERDAFKKAVEVVYDQYLQEGRLTQAELDTMRKIIAGK